MRFSIVFNRIASCLSVLFSLQSTLLGAGICLLRVTIAALSKWMSKVWCVTRVCRTALSPVEMHTWHVVSKLCSHRKLWQKHNASINNPRKRRWSGVRSPGTAYAQWITSPPDALLTNAWSACSLSVHSTWISSQSSDMICSLPGWKDTPVWCKHCFLFCREPKYNIHIPTFKKGN